jgi:hypothetical protein
MLIRHQSVERYVGPQETRAAVTGDSVAFGFAEWTPQFEQRHSNGRGSPTEALILFLGKRGVGVYIGTGFQELLFDVAGLSPSIVHELVEFRDS